jgi:prepilin signal peptidase PulO-like enzyme (type II secretory pathway)
MESLLQDRFFILLAAGLFGAVFGSFATALIYRLPREIKLGQQEIHLPKV